MNLFNRLRDVRRDEMADVIARETGVERRQVLPFADFTDTLTDLFYHFQQPSVGLISAGTTTPEIAQAAHRADLEMAEQLGTSPFTGEVEAVLRGVTSTSDIIYVANPNRVTGAHFSEGELAELAEAVPKGLVIVDEHFRDYFGPTVVGLTEKYSHLVVLRSLTAATARDYSDAGYLLAHPLMIDRIAESAPGHSFSQSDRKAVGVSLADKKVTETHLDEIRDEALRIAQELNLLGVQSRLCPTNFVLIRVASPAKVGNLLAAARVPIVNLDGYPQLKNYLRYDLRSRSLNDRLLDTLKGMPVEHLKMPRRDRRKIKLVRGAASKESGATRRETIQPEEAGYSS
jgi:histidinol-phosphate aminotransferase